MQSSNLNGIDRNVFKSNFDGLLVIRQIQIAAKNVLLNASEMFIFG